MSTATQEQEAPPPSTALAVIPRATLPVILAADENDILGKLAAKIRAHKPDISTKKGQDAIRSLAAEVRTAKADLKRLAASLTEGWRAQTAAVVEERKIIEERMDSLAEEVRRPLTEHEDEQKRRALINEGRLATIQALWSLLPPDADSETVSAQLLALAELDQDGHDWELFKARAEEAITDATRRLVAALERAEKREADAAELERLRQREREDARKDGHRAAIKAINDFLLIPHNHELTTDEIRVRLDRLDNLPARDWQEYADEAAGMLDVVRRSVSAWLVEAEAREAEARRIREEQIKTEAAEQARLAAEAKAKQEADAAAAESQRLLEEAAERERLQADELAAAAERDRLADEKRRNALERNLAALRGFATEWPGEPTLALMEARLARAHAAEEVDWQEYAEEAGAALAETIQSLTQQIAAERDRLQAAEDQRQQEAHAQSVEAERQRVADETEAKRVADERRAKNTAHRGGINRRILAGLLEVVRNQEGITDAAKDKVMRDVITAVAKGTIPRMSIDYASAEAEAQQGALV
jgi:colicin import membrane protein